MHIAMYKNTRTKYYNNKTITIRIRKNEKYTGAKDINAINHPNIPSSSL